MSFLHPQALYYLLPPLIVLFGLLLTQRESQETFFTQEVMDRLRVSANSLTLRARNALFFLIGLFMIVALAQPVIDDGVVVVKAKSSDIMIALDISDSMLAQDVYPNRLELAKQKVLTLLSDTPNERIGVMAFAKNSYLVSPLSFDTKAVSFLLTQLDTSSITEKGTDFFSVLEVFASSSKSKAKRSLLILSDGGDASDFSKEIAFAKEHNIVVSILGVGTKKGAPIKLKDGTFIKQDGEILVSKLNENIATLATSTGGVYIQSITSNDDIKTIYREIKKVIKAKELKSEDVHKYIPLFYYPLSLALVLLLIATSSLGRRTKKQLVSLFILATVFYSPDLRAGVLDFIELKDAKEAYEMQDYKKSAKLYERYAKKSNSAESYFNAANSLYKQKNYKEAIASYEKAAFDDKSLQANKLSNLGNAYALHKELKKAMQSYEKSLKLREDKDTRENLEAIKKLLKKQKNDKNKDSKNSDKKKKSQKDSKNSKDANKDSDKKSKQNRDKNSSKSKASKDKKQNSNDTKSKKEKPKDSDAKKSDEKKQLEKLKKDDDKKKSNASKIQKLSKDQMSDAEEAKWLRELNLHKKSYLYKLNKEKSMRSSDYEKPW